jgi:hypothetical protein
VQGEKDVHGTLLTLLLQSVSPHVHVRATQPRPLSIQAKKSLTRHFATPALFVFPPASFSHTFSLLLLHEPLFRHIRLSFTTIACTHCNITPSDKP